MAKMAKKKAAARAAFDGKANLAVEEAVALVKANATAKFDETVEIAMNLGVDPRHADQMVRGVCNLPNGSGRTLRVAVFARGAKADEGGRQDEGPAAQRHGIGPELRDEPPAQSQIRKAERQQCDRLVQAERVRMEVRRNRSADRQFQFAQEEHDAQQDHAEACHPAGAALIDRSTHEQEDRQRQHHFLLYFVAFSMFNAVVAKATVLIEVFAEIAQQLPTAADT